MFNVSRQPRGRFLSKHSKAGGFQFSVSSSAGLIRALGGRVPGERREREKGNGANPVALFPFPRFPVFPFLLHHNRSDVTSLAPDDHTQLHGTGASQLRSEHDTHVIKSW